MGKDVVLFSVCSALGQGFIFFVISSFSPLVCSTVTTTRKVFSVLLSIFTRGHRLNSQGWLGIGMAFLGILGELQEKFTARNSKRPRSPSEGRQEANAREDEKSRASS